MTIERIENTMSHSEYLEWIEYYKIEPFAEDRNEVQMAVLSTIQSNKAGGKSKVGDFMVSNKQNGKDKFFAVESATADEIDKIAGVKKWPVSERLLSR